MSRNRDLELDDLLENGDMETLLGVEDPGHPGIGTYGMCWLNDDRVCDQTCMAYDAHRIDDMEHPCIALSALQEIGSTKVEQRDELREAVEGMSMNIQHFTSAINNLTATISHASNKL